MFVPEGQSENSPAFERRLNAGTLSPEVQVPKGTAESWAPSHQVQPSLRDLRALRRRPGVSTLFITHISLGSVQNF